MSAAASETVAVTDAAATGWRLRWAQVLATCDYERKRMRRGRNGIARRLFIALPVLIALIYALQLVLSADEPFVEPLILRGSSQLAGNELLFFAHVFRFFVLLSIVFFAAMELFGNLFRGEIADRTLHHVFLVPLRREDVVLGKYLAGLITLFTLTFGTWLLTLTVVLLPHGVGTTLKTLLWGQGLRHVVSYGVVLLLATLAYGALYTLLGLVVRTPLHVGFVFWIWERLTTFLPQGFKRFTIVHWVETFMPVRVLPEGWFVSLGEPEHPLLALVVLLGLTAGCLLLAVRAVRRLEVSYGAD